MRRISSGFISVGEPPPKCSAVHYCLAADEPRHGLDFELQRIQIFGDRLIAQRMLRMAGAEQQSRSQ